MRGNTKNRTQQYLFICRHNISRSRAAADVCSDIATQKGLSIEAFSAGLLANSKHPLTKDLVYKADKIFVMESYMKATLEQNYGQVTEKIINLNIPDIYPKGDPELTKVLWYKLKPLL